ncbi:MAG: 2-dehydro-3-deoxygalactonokinase [Alphaproteobacteria bacterium]|nr:2-dehydro-3-deoxygalactonokinase [Alphaproteobacteria bacterium]MBV8549003.1 2-dehydro-3-deoxygalactonokinase [Alphaproteobacteria bacterium]
MSDSSKPTLILADWGNTNLRFYRGSVGGAWEKRIVSHSGVHQLNYYMRTDRPKGELYAALAQEHIGDWLNEYPDMPVLMGGAIGTNEGWSEARHMSCPATVETVAQNLHCIPDTELGALRSRKIYIVRGLKVTLEGERRHVMRSEESKSFGAVGLLPEGRHVLAMPGTHCQWTHLDGQTIDYFCTFMTGEIYHTILKHGCIASCIPTEEAEDLASFERGVTIAMQGFDLLADLHMIRAQNVSGDNPPKSFHSYASGVLIGHELMGATRFFGRKDPLTLVLDKGAKRDLYVRALEIVGWPLAGELSAEETYLRGLQMIGAALLKA